MTSQSDEDRSGISRGEIENLCVLSAIPENGCTLTELPARLGLSPLLLEPIAQAVDPLISTGWVEVTDDHVSLTSEGRKWLSERLSEVS